MTLRAEEIAKGAASTRQGDVMLSGSVPTPGYSKKGIELQFMEVQFMEEIKQGWRQPDYLKRAMPGRQVLVQDQYPADAGTAPIFGLRKKLGVASSLVETVRGID